MLGGDELNDGTDGTGFIRNNNLVEIVKIDNKVRTRIRFMINHPPSTKKPDNKLCLQAQKRFEKIKEMIPNFVLVPWKEDDKAEPIIKKMDKYPL